MSSVDKLVFPDNLTSVRKLTDTRFQRWRSRYGNQNAGIRAPNNQLSLLEAGVLFVLHTSSTAIY
jgi:hypothetical protein